MDRKAGSFVCVTKSAASRNNSCHEKANERENSLLCTAALLGHTFCVTILVDYRGADIEEVGSVSIQGSHIASGVTPLWCASNEGHSWVVEFLLCKGANPNGVSSNHSSPLRAACANGHFFVVRLLVEHGADIEAANHQGVNSLMLASVNGHLKIVKYLLDAGADVNRKDLTGKSALHASADAGHLAVTELLLDHKARMDADDSGLTPLISASSLGHIDLVERLVTRADLVSVREKADALEVLGASIYNRTGDIVVAIYYWKTAMSMSCPNKKEDSGIRLNRSRESDEVTAKVTATKIGHLTI
ncbi:protein fem-1 homolog C-like [Macrobrachium nipponense]|uniref:protein fem-1 homolog C-like n=1 Tax=Macrobrachium nipponense TaxID=159736 RepID=UPI0030C8A3CC